MNKLLKVLAASALVATVLVGCGKKGEDTGAAAEGAKYAKAGLGVVSSYSDGQVNSTIAAVGLDADGKVQYIDIDVAQSTPGGDAEKTKTKKELKEEYGMKGFLESVKNGMNKHSSLNNSVKVKQLMKLLESKQKNVMKNIQQFQNLVLI